jgi:hypothetical protein
MGARWLSEEVGANQSQFGDRYADSTKPSAKLTSQLLGSAVTLLPKTIRKEVPSRALAPAPESPSCC